MASEFIYVKGKGSWCRFVKPDLWDCWSCILHPDSESLETIRNLQAEGLKNVVKKDDDGYYVKFRRPITKKMGNIVKTFKPPEVIDKDGRPMDGLKIGNGSDLTLKLEIYQYSPPGSNGKSKAARLESVRVDNLVEFNSDTDFNQEEAESVAGLKDQPAPLF